MSTNINHVFSEVIVGQLIKQGITHFFISPGLRNAPLINTIANNDKVIVHTEFDERSGGYRALGYSRASGKPSVLICTSGTALLNYMPALAEAIKSNTPILVISADRPPEMIGMNTNQTLNQINAYSSLGISSLNLETPNNEQPIIQVAKNIAFFSHENLLSKSIPAHINVPFRNDLDRRDGKVSKTIRSDLEYLSKQTEPMFQTQSKISKEFLKRPLVLIGRYNGELSYQDLSSVNSLKICDVTSGFKLSLGRKSLTLPSIDHPEVESFIENYSPTSIIQIGDQLISKKYDTLFEKGLIPWIYQTDHQWPVPNSCQTIKFTGNQTELFSDLNKYSEIDVDLLFVEELNVRKREIINKSIDLTLPKFSKFYLDNYKFNRLLFISNSSSIRSFDYYINTQENNHRMKVYANRGVSGIEGNISTAIGLSDANKNSFVDIIIGDISFLHDLNALKTISETKKNFRIFVINDQKGGIFNLLPLNLPPEAKEIMDSPHNFTFGLIAEQFGLSYLLIDNPDDLNQITETGEQGTTLIEIKIDSEKNRLIYQELKTMEESSDS